MIPDNESELKKCLRELSGDNRQYKLIGKGSNILFPDDPLFDTVVSTAGLVAYAIAKGEGDETFITASSGAALSELAGFAAKSGLTGLEFAGGIPGSLGGALRMNAGAYGGEMANIVETINAYDPLTDKVYHLSNAECRFAYRKSLFVFSEAVSESPLIILSARLKLTSDEPEKIRQRTADLLKRRKKSQPLDYPSAGSVFKKPGADIHPAAIIDRLGLKGCCVGDACVSEKHAGFIINKGNATAEDVEALIGIIKARVLKEAGIELNTEIEIIR